MAAFYIGWTNLLAADPRLAERLHPDAVLYNLEQIEPGSPWCGPGLVGLLARHRVLDYSRQNIERLAELGLHDVGLLEIGHHPVLERIETDLDQPLDVLFYGSLNERRAEILHELGDDDEWRDEYRAIALRYTPEAFADAYLEDTIDEPRALVAVDLAA